MAQLASLLFDELFTILELFEFVVIRVLHEMVSKLLSLINQVLRHLFVDLLK